MAVSFEKSITAQRFEHINLKNSDNTPFRCKRNGKTKIIETSIGYFKIPVKHGLRGYFYIDNDNASDWNVVM